MRSAKCEGALWVISMMGRASRHCLLSGLALPTCELGSMHYIMEVVPAINGLVQAIRWIGSRKRVMTDYGSEITDCSIAGD